MCIVTFKYTLKLPKQHNQRTATRLEYTDLCQNCKTLEGLSMLGPYFSHKIMKYFNMYR